MSERMCISTEEQISVVVERYSGMVLRIAWQYLGNRADAEDVMQDVFVRLMAQQAFESEKHLKAWLIRVAINRCKDVKKSAWHRRTVPLDEDWPALTPLQGEVMAEVFKLRPDDRNLIYLYFFEGYTIPEIAALTGNNQNTVSSRFTRAKRKLRCILEEGGYSYA